MQCDYKFLDTRAATQKFSIAMLTKIVFLLFLVALATAQTNQSVYDENDVIDYVMDSYQDILLNQSCQLL